MKLDLAGFAKATRYLLWGLAALSSQSIAAPAPDSPLAICQRIQESASNAYNAGNRKPHEAMNAQNAALWRKIKEFTARIEAAKESDEQSAIKLMREKLAFVDAAPGCKFSELKEALDELAGMYESRERYAEAEPYRVRLLKLALDEHPSGELWRARRSLADLLEEQGKYAAALPHWQAALVEQPEPYRAGDQAQIAAGLGKNLLQLKRYSEAEPYLRETRQWRPLADALEAQGKWKEAEALWRKEDPTEDSLQRLEANLRKQGRVDDATTIAQQRLGLKEARGKAATPEAAGQRAAQMRRTADLLAAAGNTAGAEMMRAQADQMEAAANRPPPRPGEVDSAQLAIAKANFQRAIQEFERRGDKKGVEAMQGMLAMLERQQPGKSMSPDWAPQPNFGIAPEQAAVAMKMIEVGRISEAQALLAAACPGLVQRQRIDLPANSVVDMRPDRPAAVSPQQCFRELAMSTVQVDKRQAGQPTEALFEAAQWATQSEAGAALTRTAARKYAASLGAGRALSEIDKNFAAAQPHADKFMATAQSILVNSGSQRGLDKVYDLMTAVQQVESTTRPYVEAINKAYEELKSKVPDYSSLRNPEPIKLASLASRSGDEARLLLADEALVLWMYVPGSRKGLVFAISKDKSAWATMGLTGDEIAKRVRLLRSQIDPCAYDANRATCKDERRAFDRRAAYELHKALLGHPEIAAVVNAKDVRNLLIVPSGVLTTLPPAVLVTSQPDGGADLDASPQGWALTKWLILKQSITIMPAVSALSSLRGGSSARTAPISRSANDGLFMMADPDFAGTAKKPLECAADQRRAVARSTARYLRGGDFDAQALASLPPLPCTRREGELLLQALGGKVLFGRDAREAQFRDRDMADRLSRAEVLAFATHGLVSGEMGLGEPALALGKPLPNEKSDDGVLSASEVTRLKLTADIVLLSACNTASPDAEDAEGLSGLAKAFFKAGAKGVLVSHWRVDDAATSALVAEAIRLRRSGLSKAEALQKASIDMMRGKIGAQDEATRELSSHPSIWAPFTLIGEAR